jgi:uncharacterized protein (TIGR02246 family)
MTESVRDFAIRYTAAWCGGIPEEVAEFFAENGSLTVNAGPAAVGREAIADVARSFMTAFPDLEVILDDVKPDGDLIVYRWTLRGTNCGPGGSGRKVHLSGTESWRFGTDGLIAVSHGAFDEAEYRRQLGI